MMTIFSPNWMKNWGKSQSYDFERNCIFAPVFNPMRKLFFLSTPTNLLHFDEDTLMYVQADGNYIILHFRDSSSKVMTMQLHEFEELLMRKATNKFSKLVFDGLVIDNKPAGTTLRRALCERNGEIIVVECDHITFHDFAQTLADFNVQNAIYLMGADAYGFYRMDNERVAEHGNVRWNQEPNVTYIVWK